MKNSKPNGLTIHVDLLCNATDTKWTHRNETDTIRDSQTHIHLMDVNADLIIQHGQHNEQIVNPTV